jgi:hypothetical protein
MRILKRRERRAPINPQSPIANPQFQWAFFSNADFRLSAKLPASWY